MVYRTQQMQPTWSLSRPVVMFTHYLFLTSHVSRRCRKKSARRAAELKGSIDCQAKLLRRPKRHSYPPVLALSTHNSHMTLDINVCSQQIGLILMRDQAYKRKKLLRYWFQLLTAPERNYDTTSKECLVVIWAAVLLTLYLEWSGFLIWMEHRTLW